MSFLSILLVASAFYFAHARPESQSWSEAYGGAEAYFNDEDGQYAPAVPAQSSVSITDLQDYQHQLYGFIQDVSEAVDQYMMTKQEELKSMNMDRFASYVNYLFGRQ